MPSLISANPQIKVSLFKTIARGTVDGQQSVSIRYQSKDDFIDLTPFLGDGSSVRTSKGIYEPAGGFVISITDKPKSSLAGYALESFAGLLEPMDMVEIRMWRGVGPAPLILPIVMRGFISDIQRTQTMSDDGKPIRSVTVVGQDYGKLWQMYQVLYLPAYAEGKALLTTFNLQELFGIKAVNAMPAGEYVRKMINGVINPYIDKMLPENSPMPRKIQTGDSISVKHGNINNSYQNQQGSVYEILRKHTDVPTWNELYLEDREDGVHVVYRSVPAMRLSGKDFKSRLIQDDALLPPFVVIADNEVQSLSTSRSDSTVANFYWVNNSRFDLIDDIQRKLFAIKENSPDVFLKDYPNTAVKYYGTRALYAETQMTEDTVKNANSGKDKQELEESSDKQLSWIKKRLLALVEMNKDNVVFERGSMRVKGGPMRPGGTELIRAGDYVTAKMGRLEWEGYVTSVEHQFVPLQEFVTTINFERGEGFAKRTALEGGIQSPWLAEQASRFF